MEREEGTSGKGCGGASQVTGAYPDLQAPAPNSKAQPRSTPAPPPDQCSSGPPGERMPWKGRRRKQPWRERLLEDLTLVDQRGRPREWA